MSQGKLGTCWGRSSGGYGSVAWTHMCGKAAMVRLWPRSRAGGRAARLRRMYRLRIYIGTSLSVQVCLRACRGTGRAVESCLLEAPVAAEAEGEGGARWPPRGAVPLVEADVPPPELALLATRVREAREVSLESGEVLNGPHHSKAPKHPPRFLQGEDAATSSHPALQQAISATGGCSAAQTGGKTLLLVGAFGILQSSTRYGGRDLFSARDKHNRFLFQFTIYLP